MRRNCSIWCWQHMALKPYLWTWTSTDPPSSSTGWTAPKTGPKRGRTPRRLLARAVDALNQLRTLQQAPTEDTPDLREEYDNRRFARSGAQPTHSIAKSPSA